MLISNWKVLKEMGISDHLTYLWSNLYAGQEATVRTGDETVDGFKIGIGVHLDCVLSPYVLCITSMQSTLWKMPGCMNHKLQSKLPREMTTSDMQIIPL